MPDFRTINRICSERMKDKYSFVWRKATDNYRRETSTKYPAYIPTN
ncbi:hypothetical protein ACQVUL_04405 [Bacillus cytotoxicus]|uniref:Uncharacterized protein n=1 Tax=Bacillus cytotoxicus TaxID=580165 RepID=A0AAX2CDF9_9BACI|nr:hypothetical protein [Bacillus cytotoxicus]MDH2892420.1 hypothetical protein [Bacillus cytotoxicus]SCL86272.1 Protein of unknown function [Bacillus cytotoxicus]SCN32235.1 Protein of unknown function [Bacillus cytotoxicus]HDR7208781.1 hypothetical protein [Bacillus cytotoxicus]